LKKKTKLHKVNIYNKKIPAPQQPGYGCVLIFSKCDFSGNWAHVCRNFNLTKGNKGKKGKNKYGKYGKFTITSIKIGSESRLKTFTKLKYKGKKSVIKKSNSCLKNEVNSFKLINNNKKIKIATYPSHIKHLFDKIKHGCVFIFEKCDFQGKWAEICGSINNLNEIGFGIRFSSFKVSKGSYVRIFKDYNWKSKSKKYSKNKRCLDNNNNKESKGNNMDIPKSLKVFIIKSKSKIKQAKKKTFKLYKSGKQIMKLRKYCVLAYDKCGHKGRFARICKSIKNLKKFKFGKRIRSIKLGSKIRISLHSKVKFEGDNIFIDKDKLCLEDDDFDDIALSIKLYKNVEKFKKDKERLGLDVDNKKRIDKYDEKGIDDIDNIDNNDEKELFRDIKD